jgi:ribonuclease HII
MNKRGDGSISLEERQRLQELRIMEEEAFQEGYNYIAGLDEVGRGPIAGPVVAAAVILPQGFLLPGVDDSKRLSFAKRKKLAGEIKNGALAWSIAAINPPYLDRINILNATRKAMGLTVKHLNLQPDYLLIDALQLKDIPIPQRAIIKGDSLSISIACASIIAKVERDELMQSMDKVFPGYNFSRHKGYATREHLEQLFDKGPCPLHRVSFEPVKSMLAGGPDTRQASLFDDDIKPLTSN